MTITDSSNEVRWDAGVPLGWSEGMGREQKIGPAAALFALAVVDVIGVVTGVILLVS